MKREVFNIIDAKKGTDVYLFIEKLKPALLLGINHRFTEELKESYKHLMVDELRIIFYHDDSTLVLWEKETVKKKDFATAIGTVLGYPPNAVKLYGKDKDLLKGSNIVDPIRVDYHGQMFVTSKELFKEDISFLLKTMPIPLEHQTCIEIHAKSEPNGTFDIIKKINING